MTKSDKGKRSFSCCVLDESIFFSMGGTPVTVAKISQPKDTHIFSAGDHTAAGAREFKSNSELLYNEQQLFERFV